MSVSLSRLLRPGSLGPMIICWLCRLVSCISHCYPCVRCRGGGGGGSVRYAGGGVRGILRVVIAWYLARVPRGSASSIIIRISRGIGVGIGITVHITTSGY